MRTDRFQPQGPVNGGGGGPVRLELSRVVPLGAVIAAAAALVTWAFTAGGAVSNQANWNAAANDRMARIEAMEAKDAANLQTSMANSLARMETAAIERVQRLEQASNTRFDAFDKRGDSRMSQLNQKFDNSDKHDEALGDALNALNLRLTRLEAAREFINTNGTPAGPGPRR